MAIEAVTLKRLVEAELGKLNDDLVIGYVRGLLVEPTPDVRDWDYGTPGQQYVCWSVLEHPPSNTSIAFSEHGFGPSAPWGLLSLDKNKSMGMDSGWFPTFWAAFFESMPATCLKIWRVFRTDAAGVRTAISDEDFWDETWNAVYAHRDADPAARYDCDTSIAYDRE